MKSKPNKDVMAEDPLTKM